MMLELDADPSAVTGLAKAATLCREPRRGARLDACRATTRR